MNFQKILFFITLIVIGYVITAGYFKQRGTDVSTLPKLASAVQDQAIVTKDGISDRVQNYRDSSIIVDNDPELSQGSMIERTLRKALLPLVHKKIEEATRKLSPQMLSQATSRPRDITAIDQMTGIGAALRCGQTASVTLQSRKKDGTLFAQTSKPLTLVVGEATQILGLEQGIIGMKIGGVRQLEIPASKAYDDPNFSHEAISVGEDITLQVTLLSLSPKPPSTPPVQIFVQLFGNGPQATCGSSISLQILLRDATGEIIRDIEAPPVQFTLGKGQVPWGLEEGSIHMLLGERRTLIIPPAWSHPMPGLNNPSTLPEGWPWPNQQIIIAEITLIEILP